MNKIYLLIKKTGNYDYAEFAHVGVWEKFREYCEKCTAPDSKLVEPLQIEWEPGSDVIGDFSWCGYTITVQDKVKNFLVAKGFEVNFGSVEVHKSSTPKRRQRAVPSPYDGPKLHWLMPTEKLNTDIEMSGLQIKIDCSSCGLRRYKFKMNGLFISKSELGGRKMFRINQFDTSSATYVTEEGLQELVSQNFTNFWFRETGTVFDGIS